MCYVAIAAPFSGLLRVSQNNWFAWGCWENEKVGVGFVLFLWLGKGDRKLSGHLDVPSYSQAH